MVQRLPGDYRFDASDPRSPSQEQWDRMSADERARIVAMLPAEVPWELAPQDEAKKRADAAAERAAAEAERAAAAAKRAAVEAERATAEAERATAEAERADAAERKLAEALAEIERLKRRF